MNSVGDLKCLKCDYLKAPDAITALLSTQLLSSIEKICSVKGSFFANFGVKRRPTSTLSRH